MYNYGGTIDKDLLKRHFDEYFRVHGIPNSFKKKHVSKTILLDKNGKFIMEVPQ